MPIIPPVVVTPPVTSIRPVPRPSREGSTPKESYRDRPSINANAIGGGGSTRLNTSAAIHGLDLSCHSERGGRYGEIQITETVGGHQVVLNDTLGSERIMIRHSSGSGIEFRPDGSILISATEIVYDIQGPQTFAVSGNTHFRSDGTMTFDAGGGMEFIASGTINMQTTGNLSYDLGGDLLSVVGGELRQTVRGSSLNTVVGSAEEIHLGGYSNSVKGNMTLRVDGNGGIYTSGNMGITSQGRSFMSSPQMSITGKNLQVVGSSGTIGGESIIMYSHNSYVGETLHAGTTVSAPNIHAGRIDATESMHAVTFHGNIDGIAKFATGMTGWVPPTTGSPAVDNTDATQLPTAAIISARQQTGSNGIRKVRVDPGDYIRNAIDRTFVTGGEYGKTYEREDENVAPTIPVNGGTLV